MTKEKYNAKIKQLISKTSICDSSPTPWSFEWNDGVPQILDANGNCICVISTGTIKEVYNNKKIIANSKRLLLAND